MATLILPEGEGSTRDLPAPVALPAMDALPTEVPKVDFNEPFKDVEDIPVKDEGGSISGEMPNEDVDLYPNDTERECLTDMTISVLIDPKDATSITGEATLNVTKAEGEGCDQTFIDKAAQENGCDVTVKLTVAKQQTLIAVPEGRRRRSRRPVLSGRVSGTRGALGRGLPVPPVVLLSESGLFVPPF